MQQNSSMVLHWYDVYEWNALGIGERVVYVVLRQ
jgi:hypothetical protein